MQNSNQSLANNKNFIQITAASAMCPEGRRATRCVPESTTSLSVSTFETDCWQDVKTVLQTCNIPDDELAAYRVFYSKVITSGDGKAKIREYLKWLFTKTPKTGIIPNEDQCNCFIDRLMRSIESEGSENARIKPIMAMESEVDSIYHSISIEAATS